MLKHPKVMLELFKLLQGKDTDGFRTRQAIHNQ